VIVGTLPDDALLEIFNFYVDDLEEYDNDIEGWHTLVHVCRRWRNVVFASPRRLDLRLLCTPTTSVKEMREIWPEFPIVVYCNATAEGEDDVIDALELNDRVVGISFWDVPRVERFVAVMQGPFPALTDLELWSSDETAPALSDSFLGGSAPRLRQLTLKRIPFPALPNLLLSATDLADLVLWNIPHSGYISPEAMVTCLSALSKLKRLVLSFQSPRSRPSRAKPPPTRTILPALTSPHFEGVTEYLEDLVARIDVPLLEAISIKFFNQFIFDILQLPRFLCRTEKFTALDRADVVLNRRCIWIWVNLSSKTGTVDPTELGFGISCSQLDWQLSSLIQVYNSTLSTPSTLERLNVHEAQDSPLHWQDDIENTQWLELFHPFTNVKNLYLSEKVALCVAPSLQGLSGEQVIEVLPALQNLFLDGLQPSGPVEEAFRGFVAARQLSGRPVDIHRWEREK